MQLLVDVFRSWVTWVNPIEPIVLLFMRCADVWWSDNCAPPAKFRLEKQDQPRSPLWFYVRNFFAYYYIWSALSSAATSKLHSPGTRDVFNIKKPLGDEHKTAAVRRWLTDDWLRLRWCVFYAPVSSRAYIHQRENGAALKMMDLIYSEVDTHVPSKLRFNVACQVPQSREYDESLVVLF
jgi:hypothetical protein